MKKGFVLFVALTLLTSVAAFAKVTAVKEGDVVKVTWTYKNADAGSVGLVGDFQGWKLAEALPLTKGADGVWTITLDGKVDSSYKYKFNVDGEWTEDPEAPAGLDDGFGGSNGYANVPDLLAMAGGASDVPQMKGGKLVFGNYTSLRTLIESAGTNNDKVKVALRGKSYWKLSGYLTEEIKLSKLEIGIDDDQQTLYDGTAAAGREADGLVNVAQAFFGPFSFLKSNKDWPYLGHFTVTWETPAGDLSVYNRWSKEAKYEKFYFRNYWGDGDANALTGAFELKKTVDLGGSKLSYLFALSEMGRQDSAGNYIWSTLPGDWAAYKRAYYGLQSYADLELSPEMTVGFMYNQRSDALGQAQLDDYFGLLSHEIGLGALGKAGPLSFQTQVLIHSLRGQAFDAGKYLSLGLKGSVDLKPLTLGYDVLVMGNSVVLGKFFGADPWKDESLNGDLGYLNLKLKPKFSEGDITAGLDFGLKLSNPLLATATTKDVATTERVYIGYTMGTTTLNLYSKLNYIMYETTTGKEALQFNAAGLDVTLKDVVPGSVDKLAVKYGLNRFGTGTTATTDDGMAHDVTIQSALTGLFNLDFGLRSASGDAVGTAEKLGYALGISKKLDGKNFAGPEVFFQLMGGKLKIWDSYNEKSDLKFNDDENSYKNDGDHVQINSLDKSWKIAIGAKWDF